MAEQLTKEQESFLEECNLEFSDRFTEADLEYKEIYEAGIPTPPIMSPWYGRARYNNRDRDNRERDNRDNWGGGSSSYRNDRKRSYNNDNYRSDYGSYKRQR